MSVLAPALAQTCDGAIDVFINEHIEFLADPADTSQYTYLWDDGEATGHTPPGTAGTTFAVDAPSTVTSTDVTVTLQVTAVPTVCSGDTCYTINTHECCFDADAQYCTTDEPEWCWDDICDTEFTLDDSIYFKWYINDDTTAIYEPTTTDPVAGCYEPDFEGEGTEVDASCNPSSTPDAGYDLPTKTCPTVSNTVKMEVWQKSTDSDYPHSPADIKLDDCTDTFNLEWDPEGNVAIYSTWP